MKRGHSYFESEKPRVEIVPMIDIMMFLLVFFMVITLQMIAGSGIKLELPGSSTAQELPSTKVTIGLQKDGGMYLDGKAISPEALKEKLEEAKKTNTVEVVIAGDKATSLQMVLKVMDIVRSAGITGVGIATRTDGA